MCSDQEVLEAVRASRSLAQVLAKLGIRQSGGTQATLKGVFSRWEPIRPISWAPVGEGGVVSL